MTAASWFSLVEHLIWPAVVLVLVLALRHQIGDFLSAIGGRTTQLSVISVTIDLAVATEAAPPWKGIGGEDVRGLVIAQQVNDSYFHTLRQSLWAPGTADFMVVDLKSDGQHEWLTSRLYLFTYVLSRIKGVRSVVFTATRGDVARTFLAVAATEDLLHTLAAAEPWLRQARWQVEAHQAGWLPALAEPSQSPSTAPNAPASNGWIPPDVDEWWQSMRANSAPADPMYVAQQFLERMQWTQPAGAEDPPVGWLQLADTPGRERTWEHATWISASDLIDGVLRDAVHPDSYVLDDRSWSAEQRTRAVAQAPGDFVAMLGLDRRFERLIDRRSLLEALGADSMAKQ